MPYINVVESWWRDNLINSYNNRPSWTILIQIIFRQIPTPNPPPFCPRPNPQRPCVSWSLGSSNRGKANMGLRMPARRRSGSIACTGPRRKMGSMWTSWGPSSSLSTQTPSRKENIILIGCSANISAPDRLSSAGAIIKKWSRPSKHPKPSSLTSSPLPPPILKNRVLRGKARSRDPKNACTRHCRPAVAPALKISPSESKRRWWTSEGIVWDAAESCRFGMCWWIISRKVRSLILCDFILKIIRIGLRGRKMARGWVSGWED